MQPNVYPPRGDRHRRHEAGDRRAWGVRQVNMLVPPFMPVVHHVVRTHEEPAGCLEQLTKGVEEFLAWRRPPLVDGVSADLGAQGSRPGQLSASKAPGVFAQVAAGGDTAAPKEQPVLQRRGPLLPAVDRLAVGERKVGTGVGGSGVNIRTLLWSVIAVGLWLVVMVGMYWVFDVLPLVLLFGVAIYYAVQSSGQSRNQGTHRREGLRR